MVIIVFFLKLLIINKVLSSYLQWSAWIYKDECNRDCSQEFGQIKRTRYCEKCALDKNKKPKNCQSIHDMVYCNQYLNDTHIEFIKCYQAISCKGFGEYTGEYGQWMITRRCELVPHETECSSYNKTGLEEQRRDCLSTEKSVELAKVSKNKRYEVKCSRIDGDANERHVPCYVNKITF
jgi:hypothetical protein